MRVSLSNGALWLVSAAFLAIVAVEFLAIGSANSGKFIYALDDPYIHLALADGIRGWHYGINAGEVSAPSSSIVWPFLLALLPASDLAPLVLNILFGLLTLVVFDRVLSLALQACLPGLRWQVTALRALLLLLLMLFTNLVSIAFTGMEHSLQIFVVAAIALGLIQRSQGVPVARWWLPAVILAPLVRYENLAVSAAALLFLLMRKDYRRAVIGAVAIVLLLAGFSIFLLQQDLGFLPSSILAKSSLEQSVGGDIVFGNLRANLLSDTGEFLLQCLFLLGVALFLVPPGKENRQLIVVTMLAIFLHLLGGSHSWLSRYEAYVLTFSLLMLLYFFLSSEGEIFGALRRPSRVLGMGVLLAGFFALHCGRFVMDLFDLPLAANNIYEQQYQMRRFAQDIYQKPVAVNDLGLVSYGNPHYVLDLWGLGSLQALRGRKRGPDTAWMSALASQHNVRAAMLYSGWFASLPKGWIKAGELVSDKPSVTVPFQRVAFYAFDRASYDDMQPALSAFSRSLPAGVRFVSNRPDDAE